jgi:pimeloyl-ACP methyl ester carboxylesterase
MISQSFVAALAILTVLSSVAPAAPAAPAAAPRRDAKGQLRLRFDEHSPLSDLGEVYRRFYPGKTLTEKQRADGRFDLKQFSLDLLVPSAYRPDGTWGLFVWCGVAQPPAQWVGVLTRNKLLLVESRNGKSKVDAIWVRLPVDYVHNLRKLYTLDERRFYVGGFSAGATIAEWMQTKFPDVFSGAMFVAGGGLIPVTTLDGESVPTTRFRQPWVDQPLADVKSSVPLVILHGSNDHAAYFRAQYDGLILDGYVRAAHVEAPGTDHRLPEAKYFEQAIKALDRPEPKAAPTTAPTTGPAGPAQLAQARRLFATAGWHQDMAPLTRSADGGRARAASCLRQVIDDFPTTPYAQRAREALAKLAETPPPTTVPAGSDAPDRTARSRASP